MRCRLLIFLCFLSNALAARQNKFEKPVGWKGDQIRLHTMAAKDHQFTCLFLTNEDSIRTYLLNSDLQLVQQFSMHRRRYEEMIGGFIRDGNIYLFTERQFDEGLHSHTINIATGAVTEYTVPFDLKQERVLATFNGGDHFLYFTVNKKTPELIVHDFTSEKTFSSLRHQFTETEYLNRSIEAEKVEADAEPGVAAVLSRNKVYLRHDTLYLLMDQARSFTKVYTFYLAGQFVQERLIRHIGYQPDDGPFTSNSFLLNDELYFVQATGDSLWVDMANLHTGSTLAAFKAGSEDGINFRNTPLTQEASNLSREAERELTTKQFLRKLLNHKAFIMAGPHNNNIVALTVGTTAQVTRITGGAMPGTVGFIEKWTKLIAFKALYNTESHVQVPGKPANSIHERVDYFIDTKALKIPPAAGKIIMRNKKYYYVYYDKKERKLAIREF
jgi:hypothetical protein